MGYSGWRLSCDRGTLERCAGALEIRASELSDHMAEHSDGMSSAEMDSLMQDYAFLSGAAAALRAIIADGDGIDPAEYVGQVMARAVMRGGVVE